MPLILSPDNEADSAAAYEQPLDLQGRQIRILRLLPGEPEDPIHCTLHTAYLDDEDTGYDALSYV
ncbi:hypothetical protein QBC34DRAFT_443528 [Podospora aff. communis PSN243]|uniref:Uncharacterized protein n=1 Tax=Podospora aff. communis PSN243 TaxID=3040156 RepID=A0AAV9G6Z4_9PEZI|nr:hypothetical protein QBC34DRAFT_443528 [Podospora aff. communis PSN243]